MSPNRKKSHLGEPHPVQRGFAMKRFTRNAASILALAALALPVAGRAQDAASGPNDSPSDAEAQAAMLQAQLEAIQAQLDSLKGRVKKQEDSKSWKGAPQFADKDNGWEFKVRGRFMFDVAYLSAPSALTQSRATAGTNGEYGLRSSFRRLRLGVQGKLPGNFGYSAEVDFANAGVDFGDVILTYQAPNSPWKITLGNQEPLESLEQITSSRFISFVERSQMNEAWSNVRRLGLSASYRKQDLLVAAGAYSESIPGTQGVPTDGSNDGWELATRVNYNPKWDDNQLHFGANFQYRNFREAALNNQYRARPFAARPINVRYADSGNIAAKSDVLVGAEAAGIFGPLHAVSEISFAIPKVIKPGDVLSATQATGGTRLTGNPTFWSVYGEVGYFFTGEKRGYNANEARWDRTKVLNPFDKGGWGAWQGVVRVDYLDLSDDVGAAIAPGTGIASGTCVTATAGARCVVNGGKQLGVLAGINWYPTDYVRFMLDFHYIDVKGINIASAAGVNTLGGRFGTSTATGSLNTTLVSFRTAFDW